MSDSQEVSSTVGPQKPGVDSETPPRPPAEQNGSWEFAGWGTARRLTNLSMRPMTPLDSAVRHKLGQWKASAICGNDITSSCLYVSALVAIEAGPLAPIVLALVAGLLYLFRNVYAEVGSALPLNGGAYNVLLNTTTKAKASVAACLTLLSYVATAVISANEAAHYAHNLSHQLNVFWATVILLAVFAILNIRGISESAVVALGIFIFHITTLTLLALVCGWAIISDPGQLLSNWAEPTPGGIKRALFYGFSAALLGISGFESSANFIEEQADGVFPKTLRNMWTAVAIFNPLISVLSLGVLQLQDIGTHKEDLLAHMGTVTQGNWLRFWVSLDAVAVLSGAVLTSYVGVTGLVRRMSLDRCLPQFLLRENRFWRTNHFIILGFFALCCSILLITGGEVSVLAGVYTISFLGVMALFAIGNMLLKVRRGRLPRAHRASWPSVTLALIAVSAGLVGNLLRNPTFVKIFAIYFVATAAAVALMFLRIDLLKGVLFVTRAITERVLGWTNWINSLRVVYFTRGDNLATLNRAAQYVLSNEQTRRLLVVHVYENEEDIPAELAEHLKTLDRVYPQLRIDFIAVKGEFGPECIEALSEHLDVPKNYMFIGTPGDHFPHRIESLGGVRLVM